MLVQNRSIGIQNGSLVWNLFHTFQTVFCYFLFTIIVIQKPMSLHFATMLFDLDNDFRIRKHWISVEAVLKMGPRHSELERLNFRQAMALGHLLEAPNVVRNDYFDSLFFSGAV